MQIGYSWLRRSVLVYPQQLIVGLGLFALPISICSGRIEPASTAKKQPNPLGAQAAVSDPRAIQLRKFFARLHCLAVNFADDFIKAADENRLDWRLLPSISVVESGGGKACKNNNIFGWNQGAHVFASV